MAVGPLLARIIKPAAPSLRSAARGAKRALEDLDLKLDPGKRRRGLLGLEAPAPMRVEIDPALEAAPRLNVLLPRLGAKSLTGGPNTALIVAAGVAAAGVPVRLLALDEAAPEPGALRAHVAALTGGGGAGPDVETGSTWDAARPCRIGPADVFLATYWTTAFRLKPVLPRMKVREFIYLIQDFEPGFYAWSGAYAQALETYSMPFRALINERLLADHFRATRTGRFEDPQFLSRCAVFEPAADRRLFHPVAPTGGGRRLLFYARPRRPRNLFGIGFQALEEAVRHPVFAEGGWSFTAVGDASIGPMEIGGGRMLEPAPWLGYEDYARLMRESDILLCPMLSPHTSYPVLEMAACGGAAVTNTFSTKTEARLAAISQRIIAGPPTAEALAACLIRAAGSPAAGGAQQADVDLPSSWPEALEGAVAAAAAMFAEAVLAAA